MAQVVALVAQPGRKILGRPGLRRLCHDVLDRLGLLGKVRSALTLSMRRRKWLSDLFDDMASACPLRDLVLLEGKFDCPLQDLLVAGAQ